MLASGRCCNSSEQVNATKYSIVGHLKPILLQVWVHLFSLISKVILDTICRAIPLNTPLFEGNVYIWVDGLDTTPEGFSGQVPPPAPRSRITLQGRFKQELPFSSLLTGQVGQNWCIATLLRLALCSKVLWYKVKQRVSHVYSSLGFHSSVNNTGGPHSFWVLPYTSIWGNHFVLFYVLHSRDLVHKSTFSPPLTVKGLCCRSSAAQHAICRSSGWLTGSSSGYASKPYSLSLIHHWPSMPYLSLSSTLPHSQSSYMMYHDVTVRYQGYANTVPWVNDWPTQMTTKLTGCWRGIWPLMACYYYWWCRV